MFSNVYIRVILVVLVVLVFLLINHGLNIHGY